MEPFESDATDSVSESIDGSVLGFAGLTDFMGRPPTTGSGDLIAGSRLGDVTIVRLVDEGGMGRVYEGLQGMPCRTVAVKVIRPGVFSAAAAKRFKHEAQILGRLTHPGIARIYSVGMQQLPGCEVPYFVMEFIEDARSITSFANQRGLATRDRVQLFCEACRAVAHGHQKGVIHRDLKPGNILVDGAGQPKVIDFGVARSTSSDASLTTMHTDIGQLVGTLSHMAPEQFDGAADDLDVRADVYALGVVLYELLAGTLPYDIARRPVYEVARVVKDVEPKPLSTLDRRLRGDLNTVVAKCLEKDRDQRYSSAAELEADLGRYLRGEPITASPPRLVDSLIRLARRHRLAAATAGIVMTALLCAVAGISIFAVRADAARNDAIRQARVAAEQRETAEREKLRADGAALTSRQRLYVANLRALQSAIDNKTIRTGRQIYAENLGLAAKPLPLEMLCLGAGLDNAVATIDLGKGAVTDVAWAPDGQTLAAAAIIPGIPMPHVAPAVKRIVQDPQDFGLDRLRGSELQVFRVGDLLDVERLDGVDEDWITRWRAQNGSIDAIPEAKNASMTPLAMSGNGRRLAVHAPDGRIRILDRATGMDDAVLEGQRGRLRRTAFNADGSRIGTLDLLQHLRLWDAATGRLVTDLGDRTLDFTFSPGGSRLAVVKAADLREHEVRLIDTDTGRRLSAVMVNNGLRAVGPAILFSPDGRSLITTSRERELHSWNVDDGTARATLQGHAAIVTAAAFSPDGRRIASGATNGGICLWNAESFACEQELAGHDGAVETLAFSPNGQSLASGSHDGTVRIWLPATNASLAVLPDVRGLTAARFSPDGGQIAVAPNGSGTVELWNPATVERRYTLDAGGIVGQIAYRSDGGLVAAACESTGQGGGVRVWNAATGEPVDAFRENSWAAVGVMFSPDGSRLLTTSADGMVATWDVPTGGRLMTIASGYRRLPRSTTAVFNGDGSRVAYAMPQVIDATTGGAVATLKLQGMIHSLATSPDGRILATGAAIGNVYLADFTTGERLAQLSGHASSVRAVAFSLDGGRLATGFLDGVVRVWDPRTAKVIHELRGHEGAVETLLFSVDGRRLVTASADGTVRIWDAALGQELCVLPGQGDHPGAIAVSPDGTRMVASTSDGVARIWGLPNAEIVRARQAAATLGRDPALHPASVPASVPTTGR